MKNFDRNLGIVLDFASRVDLFNEREAVLASLRAFHFSESRGACARALEACRRDLEARGLSEREIQQVPAYRRIVQLDEMIADLSDTLRRMALMREAG